MTPGLSQVPGSGICWRWKGTGFALLFSFRASLLAKPGAPNFAGSTWIHFCVNEGLFGFVLWGTPSEADMRALVDLLEEELDRPPHAAFVDVRALSTALVPPFEIPSPSTSAAMQRRSLGS